MNGFRGDDDLWLVNDRIHALHVDAARQRLVRRADVPGADRGVPSVLRGRRPRLAAPRAARPARAGNRTLRRRARSAFKRKGACV